MTTNPNQTIDALSANARRVIIERRFGWENASPGLLATVFGTSPQHIVAICREVCAACGELICSHTDIEWAGAPA